MNRLVQKFMNCTFLWYIKFEYAPAKIFDPGNYKDDKFLKNLCKGILGFVLSKPYKLSDQKVDTLQWILYGTNHLSDDVKLDQWGRPHKWFR